MRIGFGKLLEKVSLQPFKESKCPGSDDKQSGEVSDVPGGKWFLFS
jgi:hypothetical protein